MEHVASPGPIVVGIDGSDAAIKAAEWAVEEAVCRNTPLRLVYVIQHRQTRRTSAQPLPPEEEYAEQALRNACAVVEKTDKPIKIDTAVLRDDIGSALIAESANAVMICVGSVGIARVASKIIGSTAVTLAEHAHCPVAIIRSGCDTHPMRDGYIAMVFDDRSCNDEIVHWALEEARLRKAPVLALGVWRWALFELPYEDLYRRLDDWLRRYPDVLVEVAATRSNVAKYLEGQIGRVQLVVIGSENAGKVAQLVGPHGPPILAHPDCSVLVVRG
ncbi:universal stress protein [Mycobacterium heckeshornense]|uniref:Universal stress protein n=1 Tax=Mycobacterium heckeshornense TaxID=110505 RepID=A0A2I3EK56_9MYCO|nr:universal stress protein [Mycobacterium heckeshornense]KMV20921.1 hypothetical protein ACT16_19435 [Mycobacterium heckeshornense]MCV7034952.1 universal stress protein [Mycobacterium heckeshornense]BCO34982.1 universal stress protein [Mycobacterium heckeshornense]BCQ08151.1 universal stress protein [Mycobacterium heckeshornense]